MKKLIDKVAWIYIEDKKILTALSYGNDKYYIPGGKREKNETDEETLIREVKEELTVDILKDTIKYYGTFEAQAHGESDETFVQVTCYIAEHMGKIQPSAEIQDIAWLDYKDIKEQSEVGQLIFKDLFNKGLIA